MCLAAENKTPEFWRESGPPNQCCGSQRRLRGYPATPAGDGGTSPKLPFKKFGIIQGTPIPLRRRVGECDQTRRNPGIDRNLAFAQTANPAQGDFLQSLLLVQQVSKPSLR